MENRAKEALGLDRVECVASRQHLVVRQESLVQHRSTTLRQGTERVNRDEIIMKINSPEPLPEPDP